MAAVKNKYLLQLWHFGYELYHIVEEAKIPTLVIKDENLEEVRKSIKDADDRLTDKFSPIKVAVAGRMKAGKSMMADVLFFNGEGLLRSDTTPATANITYIQCSDEQHPEGAIVDFLTKEDVAEMRNYYENQKEDGDSDDHEAVIDKLRFEAIKERLSKIDSDRVKRDKLIGCASKRISLKDLPQYSDKNGVYSDYVSYIKIYINDDRLKDLTIVDTPGLGDPVVSREQKARDEIKTCDVVFYLSSASAFMDMVDAKEYTMLKQLGCEEVFIIMSRFDEAFDAVSDDLDADDFSDTMTYMQIAQDGINRIQAEFEKLKLKPIIPPIIPVCALGAKLANYHLDKAEDDKFYRQSLSCVFPDWNDKEFIANLSGLNHLKKEIETVHTHKERIKDEANNRRIEACRKLITNLYVNLCKSIDHKILDLEEMIKNPKKRYGVISDLDKLQKSLNSFSQLYLAQIRTDKINQKFDTVISDMKKHADSAKEGINNAASPASINGAYELNFKNPIEDMFTYGIKSRMRFDKGNITYGELLEFYSQKMHDVAIPNAIISMPSIFEDILLTINMTFETIIRDKFPDLIEAMCHDHEKDELSNKYREVRKNSSKYKHKSKVKDGSGRATKNTEAKFSCKQAIDEVLNTLIKFITVHKNTRISNFFKDVQEKIEVTIEGQMDYIRQELEQQTEDSCEDKLKALGNLKMALADLKQKNDYVFKEEVINDDVTVD